MTSGPPGERPLTRVPAWILTAALLLWGGTADALELAFPLLVLALSPHLLRRRFDFTLSEFHRALDVCWVLLLGGILLVYSREPMGSVLRSFARWLPGVVFPALMAQAWSVRGLLPVNALVPLPGWRRQVDPRTAFDVAPIFVAVCLLAASASGVTHTWFYGGVVGVAGALFWNSRRRQRQAYAAALVLAGAAVGGWFVAGGIGVLQGWVEGRVLYWVNQWRGDERSDRVARTSIGRTGDVGGSSQVIMRVRGGGRTPPPRRLRLSVFSSWRTGLWYAPHGEIVKVEAVGDEWRIDPSPGREASVYVEWVPGLTGRFVPVPAGVRAIAEASVNRVERTALGAVRADVRTGLATYRADYGPGSHWEAEPRLEDRQGVPQPEIPALEPVVGELGLRGLDPASAAKRIEEYFIRSFRYTTRLQDVQVAGVQALTPIGRFLHGSRAGHCEYFATAAVLLLRHAGVPARYVTGYLVSAGEVHGDTITIREHQAHAWVRYWADGAWHDSDPTPPVALDADPAEFGWARRWSRWLADVRFALTHWWWLGEKRLLRHAYWLAVPLLAGLLWRLRRVREAFGFRGTDEAAVAAPDWPGADSEWWGLERVIVGQGLARYRFERSPAWWRRLEGSGWGSSSVGLAAEAHALHERLRFDPRGLEAGDRERLRRCVEDCLAMVGAGPGAGAR